MLLLQQASSKYTYQVLVRIDIVLLQNSVCMEITAVVIADVDVLHSGLYDATYGCDLYQSDA